MLGNKERKMEANVESKKKKGKGRKKRKIYSVVPELAIRFFFPKLLSLS